mgnify:CR=1 FL=1
MPRLLGERIQLREYQADDLEAIRQWVNDESTTCFLSTAYWPPQTMVDTEEFLQRMLQSSHNSFNFVIADRESGRYLGQLDMFTVDWRLRCGKLGMVIAGAENRGRGLGTEALLLLEKHISILMEKRKLFLLETWFCTVQKKNSATTIMVPTIRKCTGFILLGITSKISSANTALQMAFM